MASFKHHSGKKYCLHCCVAMDNHVHCVVQPLKKPTGETPVPPLEYFSLAEIMHSIKSYSSHRINRLLGIEGNIWQDENYDRIIRDDMEFNEKMNYIIYNPVKAGIVEQPSRYKWLYINPTYQIH